MAEAKHPTYHLGDVAVVIARFVSRTTGLPANPTSVQFRVQRNRGTIYIYNIGNPSVTNPLTGTFECLLPEFNQGTDWGAGYYKTEVDGDGTVDAGGASWFKVAPRKIV